VKLDIIPQETIPNGKNPQESLLMAKNNYRTGNEMVLEKEHLVGKPLVWAQWPNEEQK
jgi:hypothetical protein